MSEQIEAQVREWCRRERYVLPKAYGENPGLVILGERHRDKDLFDAQRRLIEVIRPKVILHEMLSTHVYNPQTGGFSPLPDVALDQEDMYQFDNPHHGNIPDLVKGLDIKIIGIDLSHAEFNRIPGLPDSKEAMKAKEIIMARRITENCDLRGSLVIIGDKHLWPSSEIHFSLQANEVPYIFARQNKRYK